MNGAFPNTSTFPGNWNYTNYNDQVNHFNAIQSQTDTQNTNTAAAVNTAAPVNVMTKDDKQLVNSINHDGAVKSNSDSELQKLSNVPPGEIGNQIAAQVSTLLADPSILKNALSKFQKTNPSSSKLASENIGPDNGTSSSVHLSSTASGSGSGALDPLSRYSENYSNTSLDLDSVLTANDGISLTDVQVESTDNIWSMHNVRLDYSILTVYICILCKKF